MTDLGHLARPLPRTSPPFSVPLDFRTTDDREIRSVIPQPRKYRSMSRPERLAPPELFYGETEAAKYHLNSRMQTIQTSMAERCLELLALPEDGVPRLLLDLGCGSGLSGDVLAAAGHGWVGLDISEAMLRVGVERGLERGNVLRSDLGQGFGLRPAMFDGAISVSALQWLCYSDRADHRASARLGTFFASLYRCLRRGARAALQVYPERPEQLEMMTTAALRAGFTGGVVVDFPNSTKAKKYFLCLFAGGGGQVPSDAARGSEALGTSASAPPPQAIAYEGRRAMAVKRSAATRLRKPVKSRAWILAKKDAARKRGVDNVRPDSKYSGKRRSGFRVR